MLVSRDLDTLLPNKSISVQNSCGNVRVPRGYAYRPDDNEQGKLKVVFPSLFIPAEDCKLHGHGKLHP